MPRQSKTRSERLNLDYLARTLISPLLREWRRLRSNSSADLDRKYFTHALIESFLLLRLGVLVQYAELRSASTYLAREFHSVFEAYRDASSDFQALSPVFRQIIQDAHRIEDFLSTPTLFALTNPSIFATPFRTFILLRTEMLSDGASTEFTAHLSFDNPINWKIRVGVRQ